MVENKQTNKKTDIISNKTELQANTIVLPFLVGYYWSMLDLLPCICLQTIHNFPAITYTLEGSKTYYRSQVLLENIEF